MRIKYVINSKRGKKGENRYHQMYKHNDRPRKRGERDFHQNIVVRFLLTVIRLVSVCVCVSWVLILLQARTYHQTSSKPKMAFSLLATYVYNEDRIR